ncbi:lipopolysaccharide biosynthesis protein [Nitratireductor luteus]|uniref:lipopolysaccharide biosynthesis protein n=1 Tax=Nitratireductor luteus TaxID=2976980 RepID=UPI002240814B|nr:lipopolysaccharide biosynthesis protein [Nitratireductor luteus]
MHQRLTDAAPNGKDEIPRYQHKVGRSAVAFRGVFWYAVSLLVPAAVNFAVFLITSRVLSPEDFGVVALAVTISMLAVALGPVGFGEALVQRASLRADHLDTVFWLCISFAALVAALMYAGSQEIARLFGSSMLGILIPIFALKTVLELASVVPNALIVRSMRFHLVALRTLIATLISAAIAIAVVLAGYGLWALVFAQLAASFVKAVTTFWTSGWRPSGLPRLQALRELARYGFFACGNEIVQFLGSRADQALIGLVLGVRPVGLYNFSRRIFSMVNDVVSGALGTVSHPMFSEVQHQPDKVRHGFLVSTFLSSVVSFPIFAGIALVADRAIPLLFGDQWIEALQPLRLLCALGIISCIGTLQSSLIKSRGKAEWWFYYQLVSSLLNLALVIVFAQYGITAMLAAMVAKTYLVWPVAVTMTLRLLDMRLAAYARQFAAPLAAVVVMGAAVLLAREFTGTLAPAIGIAADVAVGAATYVMALLAFASRRILDLGGTVLSAARAR